MEEVSPMVCGAGESRWGSDGVFGNSGRNASHLWGGDTGGHAGPEPRSEGDEVHMEASGAGVLSAFEKFGGRQR